MSWTTEGGWTQAVVVAPGRSAAHPHFPPAQGPLAGAPRHLRSGPESHRPACLPCRLLRLQETHALLQRQQREHAQQVRGAPAPPPPSPAGPPPPHGRPAGSCTDPSFPLSLDSPILSPIFTPMEPHSNPDRTMQAAEAVEELQRHTALLALLQRDLASIFHKLRRCR